MNKIACKICKKTFKSLMSHLRGTHKITSKEYLMLYPNSPLVSESTKQKASKSCIEGGAGRPVGIKMSEEQKEMYREIFKGEGNPFYGKKHSEKTKQKMSENHADFNGNKNPLRKALKRKPELHEKLSKIAVKRWASRTEEEKELIFKKVSESNANSEVTKAKKYHKHHNSDWFENKKCGKIFCRSSWEQKVAAVLSEDARVCCFSLEKYSVPYINKEGKERKTKIDFLATLVNGQMVMIDVKPHSLLKFSNNQHKQNAYKKHCKKNKIHYLLFYENNITIIKNFLDEVCHELK
jgi:hypothetical protein